jgi:hypothetical protein
MSYQPKPNTGTLWPNDRKASPNHPDARGDVFVDRTFLQDMIDKTDGNLVRLQIAGWNKQIGGKSCVSLSVSAPYVKPGGNEPVPF